MSTLFLFGHCGNHFPPPPFEGCVFNHPIVMSCLIWALVVIILSLIVSCYLKKVAQIKKDIAVAAQEHELAIKEKNFVQEKYWHEESKKAKDEELARKIKEYNELTKLTKDEELARKIREYNELTKLTKDEELARKIKEYNELTIHLKILEKVTGVDKDIEDLKKALEEMKKKYESLDGEIEQIIIKKKQ